MNWLVSAQKRARKYSYLLELEPEILDFARARVELEPENFEFGRARVELEPENFEIGRARVELEPEILNLLELESSASRKIATDFEPSPYVYKLISKTVRREYK